jgi:hypothetical protein
MNAITLAAGESPGLSQGCGPDDGGSRPIEVRLIVFRCVPRAPFGAILSVFGLADDPTLFSITAALRVPTVPLFLTPPGGSRQTAMLARLRMFAFAVAIGGKADMGLCTAYVRL